MMSKLFKNANSEQFPAWADADSQAKDIASKISPDDWQRMSSPSIDDDQLIQELDLIEQKAASGEMYVYNVCWGQEAVSSIREYATIHGCDAIGVNPDSIEVKAYFAVGSGGLSKSAVIEDEKSNQLPFEVIDAFRFDEKGDLSHMDKKDWEKITPEEKMGTPDVIRMSSDSVVRLGSCTEDNNLSPHMAQRRGQNSVLNPEAIEETIKSDVEDTGERLKRENKERSEERAVERKSWEREAVKKAEDLGYGSLSLGSIKPATGMHAHSGIKDEPFPKAEKLPEKTRGEKLKDVNDERKASIQRSKEDDRSWAGTEQQRQTTADVSDTFAQSLKEQLNKTLKE